MNVATKGKPWSSLINATTTSSANDSLLLFNNDSKEIQSSVLDVLRKFVYFAEEPTVLDSYTEEEIHIFDNYVKAVPSLLQQVKTSMQEKIDALT